MVELMKVLNRIIVAIFFGAVSSTVNAQDSKYEIGSVYDYNHFSCNFQTGLNRTQFIRELGNEEFDDRIESVHLISIAYQFNFYKYFGLQVRAGVGFQPFIRGFESHRTRYLFQISPYSLFTRLGLGLNFHKELKNDEWGIDGSFGGNFSLYTGGHANLTLVTLLGNVSPNQFNLVYDYEDIPIGVIDGSFGVTRKLENQNLLGLYLVGEYYPKPIITGTYTSENGLTSGNILNNGSNIGLKLKYSFTRSLKKNEMVDLYSEKNNIKLARQTNKKNKRDTNFENMYITAGSGLFFARNITRSSLKQVRSSAAPSWNHYIRFEKGIREHYFFEIGASAEKQWSSLRMKDIMRTESDEFISSTVNFGFGKKLIRKKTNWNYLSVSVGAAVSYRMDFIGFGSSSGSSTYSPYIWAIESEGRIDRSPVFFSLYSSITRDIHLFEHLFLSLNYRFQQGLNTTIQETLHITANPGNIEGEITRKINGTSSAFNVGLKYMIPN